MRVSASRMGTLCGPFLEDIIWSYKGFGLGLGEMIAYHSIWSTGRGPHGGGLNIALHGVRVNEGLGRAHCTYMHLHLLCTHAQAEMVG